MHSIIFPDAMMWFLRKMPSEEAIGPLLILSGHIDTNLVPERIGDNR